MVTNRKSAVMALLITAILFSTTVITAMAQTTPGVDRRERRQSRRIKHGVRSGSLTRHEARRLSAQQARIRRHERRVKSDGVVTARERRSLQRQENRASRNIYRKKHNRRNR
jgi:hypothetical protein